MRRSVQPPRSAAASPSERGDAAREIRECDCAELTKVPGQRHTSRFTSTRDFKPAGALEPPRSRGGKDSTSGASSGFQRVDNGTCTRANGPHVRRTGRAEAARDQPPEAEAQGEAANAEAADGEAKRLTRANTGTLKRSESRAATGGSRRWYTHRSTTEGKPALGERVLGTAGLHPLSTPTGSASCVSQVVVELVALRGASLDLIGH
jgi:hypothetical protein